jgi:hypothetical protein
MLRRGRDHVRGFGLDVDAGQRVRNLWYGAAGVGIVEMSSASPRQDDRTVREVPSAEALVTAVPRVDIEDNEPRHPAADDRHA